MRRVGILIFFILFICLFSVDTWSQGTCTSLGQNPFSAFPVCGTNVFTQTSVPACGIRSLPTNCTGNAQYSDINPYWYKFTCYASGTLGFIITPVNQGDDYDWQLFDITGRDPMDVYTDKSMIVSANWSGSPGVTGASSAAKNALECASIPTAGVSTYSMMPNIIVGHEYLLLVSHYDGATQSGYTLTFPKDQNGGGTASIVNPVVPQLVNAAGSCDGTEVTIKLNKRIDCKTLAANGSDFTLSGPISINVLAAAANACSIGFDADSIVLKLNTALVKGNYTVTSKIGTDGNTLTDNCANNLLQGEKANFGFVSNQYTAMDSISPVVCITNVLELIFDKALLCNSIAADGSDFVVSGPVPVTVKSAAGVCSNGISTIVRIQLTAPIRVNGNFTITLRNGTDGNPLIDKCGFVTPAGSTLPFTTQNITLADFNSTVTAGCKYDTILLTHDGNGLANKWQWTIDSVPVSSAQNPVLVSKAFGARMVSVMVSNGICSDTAIRSINLPDHTVKAGFTVADTLCPDESLQFTDNSSSNASSWRWVFGNGNIEISKTPAAQLFPRNSRPTQFTSSLTVANSFNCTDIAYKIITVLSSCYIAVPSAFTPNGDGLNDYLYPLNAFKADDLLFRVYNRYGQLIFETKDWTKKWDGRFQGMPQPSGTYVWTFTYTNKDNGEKMALKGTTVLIR